MRLVASVVKAERRIVGGRSSWFPLTRRGNLPRVTRSPRDRQEAKQMARRLLAEYERAGLTPPPDQFKRLQEMAATGDGDEEPDEVDVA